MIYGIRCNDSFFFLTPSRWPHMSSPPCAWFCWKFLAVKASFYPPQITVFDLKH